MDEEFNENELLFNELCEKTKDCGRVQFINLLMKKERESQELKKQLDNYKNKYKNRLNNQLAEGVEPDFEDFYLAEIEGKSNEYDELIIKQKEFIEWLENEIKRLENTEFYIESIQKAAIETHKHNLSKYKEIIGDKK